MKKIINKLILILFIINVVVIYFAVVRTNKKVQEIYLSENSLVDLITIDYSVQANPFAKVEVNDISNTDAEINSCVGSLGQSFEITGNFYNSQLKEAEVSMEYNEEKLGGVPEENIGVLWDDKENGKMVIVNTKVDTNNNTITFKTDHFSEYILVDLETWKAAWNKRLVKKRSLSSSFNVAFVIDDSGSMTSNDPKNLRLEATEEFVGILDDKDQYSIIKFDDSASLIQESTNNKEMIKDIDSKFRSNGGTNICSGVELGISELKKDEEKTRVIVLLTDGEDSGLKNKREDLIREAVDNDIVIFTIFLNTGSNTNKNNTYDIEQLAAGTGGEFYTINSDELVNIFKQISKVSVGVDGTTDTDRDGIADEIELGGLKDKQGHIVYTNPYARDTDGDGLSDREEVGDEKDDEGIQYYDFNSDPSRSNHKEITYEHMGPSEDAEAQNVWDSGFKLNRDAFRFNNFEYEHNGGVCYGIAYVVERTFNKSETIRSEVEDNVSFDEDSSTGYKITKDSLDIVFDESQGLPYFYYPKNSHLYSDRNMTKEDMAQGTDDSELTACLYYYLIERNIMFRNFFQTNHEEDGKVKNAIDEDKSITEDTLNDLKLLFRNKKIVTLGFYSKDFKHAVNAYALEKVSESKYYLYIYDSNYSYLTKSNRKITLTKVKGTNRYKAQYTGGFLCGYSSKGSNNEENNFIAIEYNNDFINYSDAPIVITH